MNLALRRSEYTVFSWISEIRDRSLGAHQEQLTKLLKLLDPLFEDILHSVHFRNSYPSLQASDGIGSQQFGPCGRRDARGTHQAFAVQR